MFILLKKRNILIGLLVVALTVGLCLAVTATRQSATAREPPVSSGRPPRNTAAMWKPWKI